jgi:hypothetical protein
MKVVHLIKEDGWRARELAVKPPRVSMAVTQCECNNGHWSDPHPMRLARGTGRSDRQLWLTNTDDRCFQLPSPYTYDAWAAAERVRASGEGVLARDRIRRAALHNCCTDGGGGRCWVYGGV